MIYYIGCIPLWVRDTPPPEQTNCQGLPCGNCNDLMWVSEAKREIVANTKKEFKLWCFNCIIKELPYVREHSVDISEVKW